MKIKSLSIFHSKRGDFYSILLLFLWFFFKNFINCFKLSYSIEIKTYSELSKLRPDTSNLVVYSKTNFAEKLCFYFKKITLKLWLDFISSGFKSTHRAVEPCKLKNMKTAEIKYVYNIFSLAKWIPAFASDLDSMKYNVCCRHHRFFAAFCPYFNFPLFCPFGYVLEIWTHCMNN